jgi:hypothetical protein
LLLLLLKLVAAAYHHHRLAPQPLAHSQHLLTESSQVSRAQAPQNLDLCGLAVKHTGARINLAPPAACQLAKTLRLLQLGLGQLSNASSKLGLQDGKQDRSRYDTTVMATAKCRCMLLQLGLGQLSNASSESDSRQAAHDKPRQATTAPSHNEQAAHFM